MCKLLRFVGLGDGDDRGVLKWELGTAASERPSSFASSESSLIPELVQNQDYGRRGQQAAFLHGGCWEFPLKY